MIDHVAFELALGSGSGQGCDRGADGGADPDRHDAAR
jgi:hypothetical protein